MDKLPRAKNARWKYVNIEECLKGTRTTVLGKIKAWIRNEETCQIYWLNGLAGTGKSTIAKSIAHFAADEGQLGASFFCSHDENDRSDVTLIFPTLAFQLSEVFPKCRAELIKVIDHEPDIGHALPLEQLQKLIVGPFCRIGLHTQSILIVIDALDECKDENAPSTILMALAQFIEVIPFLKVFVTSRPENDVRDAFDDSSLQPHRDIIVLDRVDPNVVDEDIGRFLNVQLQKMAERRRWAYLSPNWPPMELVKRLVQKAAGLFIFASTLCKFIDSTGDLEEQLEEIAQLSTSDHEGRLGIDQLYRKVLDSAMENFSDQQVLNCHSILGTIILLQNPLSLTDLSQLMCVREGRVAGLLRGFHSVIAMPPSDDKTAVIRIIHSSFRDFLTNGKRCLDTRLLVQPALQHREIVVLFLFKRMMEDLQEGIIIQREHSIDGPLAYACFYWADHLSYVSRDRSAINQLLTALDEFVRNRLLYWVEALSCLGSMHIAVMALRKTRTWYSVCSIYSLR